MKIHPVFADLVHEMTMLDEYPHLSNTTTDIYGNPIEPEVDCLGELVDDDGYGQDIY